VYKDTNIIGIINLNDDSFYRHSRVENAELFRARAEAMFSEGADIIDIGACSSRPGSVYPGEAEEWKRLRPAVEEIGANFAGCRFSVDTFSSEIVRRVYDSIGPFIVNDITAGEADGSMLETVASLGLPYIAMHSRGNGQTMDSMCDYADVVEDVKDYFRSFGRKAEEAGVKDWILDPGFGFAKTVGQNLEMLARLGEFRELGRPVLVGISRKRMVWEPLGLTPDSCLDATLVLQGQAALQGAAYLRVHDVAACRNYLGTIL
jgi:dihydropteroate synthase